MVAREGYDSELMQRGVGTLITAILSQQLPVADVLIVMLLGGVFVQAGDQIKEQAGSEVVNPYVAFVEDADGVDKLRALRKHPSKEVEKKAAKLLTSFFEMELSAGAILRLIAFACLQPHRTWLLLCRVQVKRLIACSRCCTAGIFGFLSNRASDCMLLSSQLSCLCRHFTARRRRAIRQGAACSGAQIPPRLDRGCGKLESGAGCRFQSDSGEFLRFPCRPQVAAHAPRDINVIT